MQTMGHSLLEYHKQILEKISFADRALFRKELRKAFQKLVPTEREALKRWFRETCVCRAVQGHEGLVVQPRPVQRFN